jgi:hypothetical protein
MEKLNKNDILKYINITDKISDKDLHHIFTINNILEKKEYNNTNWIIYIIFTIIIIVIIVIIIVNTF